MEFDERALAAVARWQAARERGEPLSIEELCREIPELEAQVREQLSVLERMQWLDASDVDRPGSQADQQTVDGAGQAPVVSKGTRVRYIGDYEILSEIARGGMGVVYKARQTRLRRAVALKMMLAAEFASPAEIQRFRTEAEAAARLDHPQIVPVFEVGEDRGRQFFSMGYVDGPSLAVRLQDGPLAPREAARLVRLVAVAVQYAHEQGVLHRDLKPANILLDRDGQPRITDFGLAKRLQRTSEGPTGDGQILGTPSYMPPEQASGDQARVRETADVYALGGVLYATLTGRPPFQSDNPLTTLRLVLEQEPVAPRRLNAAVPADLETICLKCLQKSPARRYSSARELADDLQRYLDGRPILARPTGRVEAFGKWARRRPAVAGLSSAIALTLVVGAGVSTYYAVEARERASTNLRIQRQNERLTQAAQADAQAAERDAALALRREREAQIQTARLELEEALTISERGDASEGVLRMASAYERALGAEDSDLADACRSMISLWLPQAPRLRRTILDASQPVAAAYGAGDLTVLIAGTPPAPGRGVERALGLRIHDARTGEQLAHFPGVVSPWPNLVVSPDQSRVLLQDDAGRLRWWSTIEQGWAGEPLAVESPPVRAWIELAPPRLLTQDRAGKTSAWNLDDGRPAAVPDGPAASATGPRSVSAPVVSPDGRWTAIVEEQRRVRLRRSDASAGGSAAPLHAPGRVTSMQFTLEGSEILVATEAGTVEVWDLPPRDNPRYAANEPPPEAVRFLIDQGRTLTVGPGRYQSIEPIGSADDAGVLTALPAGTVATASDEAGRYLVGFTGEGRTYRVRLSDRAVQFAPGAFPAKLLALQVSKPGDSCAVVTDGSTGLFRLDDMTPIGEPIALRPILLTVRYSDDGRLFFLADRDWRQHRLRRVEDGVDLPIEVDRRRLLLHPDGERLLSCFGGKIEVWNRRPARLLRSVEIGGGTFQSIDFANQGRRIWVVTTEGVARCADLETGERLPTAIPAGGGVGRSVLVRPDGRWLATFDSKAQDLDLVHWHLASGRRLGAPSTGLKTVGDPGALHRIEYSPDSQAFVVDDSRNTYRLVEPPSEPETLRALVESWTGLRRIDEGAAPTSRAERAEGLKQLAASSWREPSRAADGANIESRVAQLTADGRVQAEVAYGRRAAVPLLRHARRLQAAVVARRPDAAVEQQRSGEICLLLGRDHLAARDVAEATEVLRAAEAHYDRSLQLEPPTGERLGGWGYAAQTAAAPEAFDRVLGRLSSLEPPLATHPDVLCARGRALLFKSLQTADVAAADRLFVEGLQCLEDSYSARVDPYCLRTLSALLGNELVRTWKGPQDSPRARRTLESSERAIAWGEQFHRTRRDVPDLSSMLAFLMTAYSTRLQVDLQFDRSGDLARRSGDVYRTLVERGFGHLSGIPTRTRIAYANAAYSLARTQRDDPQAELRDCVRIAESVTRAYREHHRREYDEAAIWIGLGIARLRLGEPRGALEAFDTALKAGGPRDASTLFWRAAAWEQTGDAARAAAEWQEAETWAQANPTEFPRTVAFDREMAARYRRPPPLGAKPVDSSEAKPEAEKPAETKPDAEKPVEKQPEAEKPEAPTPEEMPPKDVEPSVERSGAAARTSSVERRWIRSRTLCLQESIA